MTKSKYLKPVFTFCGYGLYKKSDVEKSKQYSRNCYKLYKKARPAEKKLNSLRKYLFSLNSKSASVAVCLRLISKED